jgi:hypothetical protein
MTTSSNQPCAPYPDDASYKTIAVHCPRCNRSDCWRRYLSWEKSHGISINAKDHPAEVDEDHAPREKVNGHDVAELAEQLSPGKPGESIAMLAIPIDLANNDVFHVKLRAPGIVRAVSFWLKQPKVLGASSARRVEPVPQPELHVECDPNGELRQRHFAFIAGNHTLPVHAGYEVKYVGTATRANHIGHLFEIVEVPS